MIRSALSQARRGEAAARRRLLWGTARAVRWSLAASVGGALVRQAGFLAAPLAVKYAIDDGIVAGDAAVMAFWCAVVAAAAVLQFIGMCVWDQFANLADARAGALLRTRVRAGALAGTGGLGTGDLLVRAGRDVDAVRVWIHGLPTWAVIGASIGVLVPGFASLDPWLLVVALAVVPCLAVLSFVYPRRFQRASASAADAHGRRADAVEHLLRSAVTLRGSGAERAVVDRHHLASAELTVRTVRASGVLARWTAFGEGVPAVATAVGVLIGVFAVADGRLTVGGLTTFSLWMGTVGIAVQVGLQRWTQSVDAAVSAARLHPVLARSDEVEEVDCPPVRTLTATAVVAVDGADPVDLAVRPGRIVGVTGPTASGKSALLRVLCGARPPAAGAVVADGVPVTGPLSAVHLVPQRPLVLSASIRENLALGAESADPDADALRYRRALASVGLDRELFGRAGDVLDLVVGEGGTALSGGQCQRLALARALVAEPDVLLLDDVSSAVDATTAHLIADTIRHFARDRAVVVAGHGFLIDAADEVVRLGPRVGAPA